jgi:uncharacterized metal-binding protein YceD (DUF177 family)
MFLDIADLPPEGLAFDHPVSVPDRADDGDDRPLVRAGRIRGTVVPDQRGAWLEARLEGRLCLGCSRCLEPYEVDLGTDVALTLGFRPEGEATDDEDDDTLYPVEGGRVSLDEIAREQVLLAVPLKPVCSATCRGLCPGCGTNRNRLECGCRADDSDPRLAPLRDLRSRMR